MRYGDYSAHVQDPNDLLQTYCATDIALQIFEDIVAISWNSIVMASNQNSVDPRMNVITQMFLHN